MKRIYLRESIIIEVTELDRKDRSNDILLEISHYIDIISSNHMSIIFKYNKKEYLYFCDVGIFFKKYVIPLSEIRNNKINEIIN